MLAARVSSAAAHHAAGASGAGTGGNSSAAAPVSLTESTGLVEHIVQKRTAAFDYLKRAHRGRVHWYVPRTTASERLRSRPVHALASACHAARSNA